MDGSFLLDPSNRTRSGEGCAVVACAVGLDIAETAPFVRSLRSVFQGPVFLLVDQRPTLIAWLKTHRIEVVVSPRRAGRWAQIADVLEASPVIETVMIADPRAVVFQADPFRHPAPELQFVEDLARTVNSALVQELIGSTLARRVLSQPSVLTEVISGPRVAAIRFCRTMHRLAVVSRSGLVVRVGVDKAVSAIIARLRLAGGVVAPASAGRVAVVTAAHRIERGRVVNPNGQSSPIVCGYDRSPAVQRYLDARWGVRPRPRPGRLTVWRRFGRRLQALARGLQFPLAPTPTLRLRNASMMLAARASAGEAVARTFRDSA